MFESLSVAGLTDVEWESVPGFGRCNADTARGSRGALWLNCSQRFVKFCWILL